MLIAVHGRRAEAVEFLRARLPEEVKRGYRHILGSGYRPTPLIEGIVQQMLRVNGFDEADIQNWLPILESALEEPHVLTFGSPLSPLR